MRTPIARMPSSTRLMKSALFIAASLRAPITIIGPLTDGLRATFHLGAAEAGLLTALPLLAFAVVSPFAAWLAKYGLEKSLFGAMALITAGILVRSAGSLWSLYVGTCVIGCGVAVGNVLLPSLLKREFSDHMASLTATYVIIMALAAACASVVAVPLARASGFGWPIALGSTAVLPLLAGAWIWKLDNWAASSNSNPIQRKYRIWSSAMAWQVTLFLGLNSFVYYVAIGWLPSILIEFGYSPEQAGSLHGAMQISGAIPALLLIPAASRVRDHGKIAAGSSLLSAIGIIGLILEPNRAGLWIVAFGAGTGAALVLGLSFLGLRASSSHGTAVLSGMAQGVGYGLAAAGPPLIGAFRQTQNAWTLPLLACAVLCVLMSVLGMLAGRSVTIESQHDEPSGRESEPGRRPADDAQVT